MCVGTVRLVVVLFVLLVLGQLSIKLRVRRGTVLLLKLQPAQWHGLRLRIAAAHRIS